ncbi:hypothetical protein UA08_02511 [Talaromyces atroroseus]|uniref:Methyltransferase domain-containing protein n=1 Tax=Talaromyces atroroseus TaxID=1441469 RepID=A0A225AN57_TALAT|nr:hypothetical protein UA08_02511 [Talaromyces atroroseus]OKL62320.1 hypothetical protein UA08_02511 [Talaromyces atroroseus]
MAATPTATIWAVELATQLASSARIRAYDVADTHFPRREYWPSNITFDKLDSLSDPPSSLVGKFDVVHLRMWAFVIRDNDPSPLIRHAAKLLKLKSESFLVFISIEPGGYLQWEDARFGSNVAKGDAALHVQQMMDNMGGASKLNFQWLDQLDQHVKNAGVDLDVIDCQYKSWSTQLIPLCTDTFLGAIENSGAILEHLKKVVPSVPSPEEWNNGLETLHGSMIDKCQCRVLKFNVLTECSPFLPLSTCRLRSPPPLGLREPRPCDRSVIDQARAVSALAYFTARKAAGQGRTYLTVRSFRETRLQPANHAESQHLHWTNPYICIDMRSRQATSGGIKKTTYARAGEEASALRRELQNATPPTIDHCFEIFFRDYHPLLPLLDPTNTPNALYGK